MKEFLFVMEDNIDIKSNIRNIRKQFKNTIVNGTVAFFYDDVFLFNAIKPHDKLCLLLTYWTVF